MDLNNRGYDEEVMAGQMERPTSRMDQHRSELEQLNNNLERALGQLEQHLGKLRGHQPQEAKGVDGAARVDPPLADDLDRLAEMAMQKVAMVNNMAEELGGFI